MKKSTTKVKAKAKPKAKPKAKVKKKPAKELLQEAIDRSHRRAKRIQVVKEVETKKIDILINSINLGKYDFVKRSIYRRHGNFARDCGHFEIALIKCTNNIDFNVEIFDSNTEESGIYIKTISKEKELVQLLKALLQQNKKAR